MSEIENTSAENVTSGLAKSEVEELVAYVNGETATPPAALDKMMSNIYQKMMTVAGYSVANEVQRQAKLSRYLAKVEEELFDEDMISTLSKEDLMEIHKRVSDESNRSQEATRRWLKENKDTLNRKQTEIEKLSAQLSALSPDKLASIKAILQGESLVDTDEALVDL